MNWWFLIPGLISLSSALSANARPPWTEATPSGFKNDYFVGKGANDSRTEAERIGFLDAVSMTARSGPMRVDEATELKRSVVETLGSNGNSLTQDDHLTQDIRISGQGIAVSGLQQVETFCDFNQIWSCWVLVSVPKKDPIDPPSEFSRVGGPIARSVVLPGWGQLHRKSDFLGYSMMGLFLASFSGGYISHSVAVSAAHDAAGSRTQTRRDYFNQQNSDFTLIRNAAWVLAGSVYAWNIVDVIAVKDPNYFAEFSPSDGKMTLVARF